MSQYRIISIFDIRMFVIRIISIFVIRTINIINCAQEGASLISKQGAVKKKMRIVSTSRPHEQNGFRVSLKLCLNLSWRK